MAPPKPATGLAAAYFALRLYESDAAALYSRIAEHCGDDEARRVFVDAIPKQDAGRPAGPSRRYERVDGLMIELFDLFHAGMPGARDHKIHVAVAKAVWKQFGTAAGFSEDGVRQRLASLRRQLQALKQGHVTRSVVGKSATI